MTKKIFLLSLVCASSLNAGTYDDKLEEYKNAQRAFNELCLIGDRSEDISPEDQSKINTALCKKVNSTKKKLKVGYRNEESHSSPKFNHSYIQKKIDFWSGVIRVVADHGNEVKMPVNPNMENKLSESIQHLETINLRFSNFDIYHYDKGKPRSEAEKLLKNPNFSFSDFAKSNCTRCKNILNISPNNHVFNPVTIGGQVEKSLKNLVEVKNELNKPFNLTKFAAERIESWNKRAKDAGINLSLKSVVPSIPLKTSPQDSYGNSNKNNAPNTDTDVQ